MKQILKFQILLLIFLSFSPFSSFSQGSFHLGAVSSYRADVPNTTLFGRPIPSVIRFGLLGVYQYSSPLSITGQLAYRQERGQVTDRDVGPGFGAAGIEWAFHFVNPELTLGYRMIMKSNVGVTFFAGLGASFPFWSRTLTIENNGQVILTEGSLEREFRNQYLILGVEIPFYAERGWAITLQPEYARPFKNGQRLRPTHELGVSLIIRGGGV
ncbi:MAG: autotransporter outer membrane beta-barrel domain-containing protein [Bacteroidota bacterium]